MRVALVADVPDELVALVELVLGEQRQRELDDAESGAEVPAGADDRVDDEGADLGGQRAQAVVVHVLDVLGRAEGVEQRIGGFGGAHFPGKPSQPRLMMSDMVRAIMTSQPEYTVADHDPEELGAVAQLHEVEHDQQRLDRGDARAPPGC